MTKNADGSGTLDGTGFNSGNHSVRITNGKNTAIVGDVKVKEDGTFSNFTITKQHMVSLGIEVGDKVTITIPGTGNKGKSCDTKVVQK